MNPQLAGILLVTLLGAALGNRMRYFDCRSPDSSCKETVTTCGEQESCGFQEHKPHSGLEQMKLSGNPSESVIHQQSACVDACYCNQEKIELVGDMTDTTQRDCCSGDLCNSAAASTAVPASVSTAAATALAWLLPGLWRGWW